MKLKTLIDLYNLIEAEKIILEENWKNQKGLNGIYVDVPDYPPIIGINKYITNDLKKLRSALSEELGHHFTTKPNLTKESKNYTEKLLKEKEETKAKTWGANFLVSDDEFTQALLKCISDRYEICEHFEITNELLEYKLMSILKNENRYKLILNKIKMNEVAYSSCNI